MFKNLISTNYNRLGGSSLLGCVVYGRVAGDSASRYLFQNLSSATANCRLGQIARQLAPYQTIVSVDPTNQKVHLEILWGSHKDATSNILLQFKLLKLHQVRHLFLKRKLMHQHVRRRNIPLKKSLSIIKKMSDCWVIINGEILNVTNFLPDHPGVKQPF
ncbi:hypothetical protein C2G38_1283669 [Gigaspora rosea]|uniref:Cytochrome b5 heme-binding domain-containing protein n=1 Tax=Gigaspora rosea TaxID=44941 RepID=A0A397W9B0_9GLOM|nr:hypothetical protein C2G38_1283669 [Gigaspora rosea]